MELSDYLRIIRGHWRAILLATLIGALAAWILTIFTPRVYAANATGVVTLSQASSTAAEESMSYALARQRAITYVELAKTAPTAQRVIDTLKLSTTPDALSRHVQVTLPNDTAALKVRSRIDRRIRDADTVTRIFGVTVAGAIPASSALGRQRGELIPIAVHGTRDAKTSSATEAFLKIRTNLQFMVIDKPPRVIVVTSPLPGDGNSTVAANLAVSLAEAETSVILLDGDLRRPVVAESFGLLEGAGLTDLLTGKATLDEVSQHPTQSPQFTVVGVGSIPPNPSELLGSNAMRQLLQSLKREHVVIMDAPPLLPVTDAAVLTANADGALIVITAGKTLDTQLDAALGYLEQVNGHVLGVVFNKVATSGSAGYGSYGYYGNYGYYADDRDKVARRDKPAKEPAVRSEEHVGTETTA